MNNHLKGYLFATFTIIIWGSTFVITKLLLSYLEPSEILITRFFITILFLSIIHPKFNVTFQWKNDKYFLLSGVSIALYFIFENNAIKHTYASNVSLIIATIPLLTSLLTSIINKTNYFTKKTTFGFLLAYVGVVIIVLNENNISVVNPLGDIFAFIAASSFAVYSIFLVRIDQDIHIIQRTRRIFTITLFTILLYAMFTNQPIIPQKVSLELILGLLFLSVVASGFAFLLWNKAVEYNGANKTNTFTYLNPVITMIFSFIVLHESFTLMKIIGGITIILGIYLSEKK